ncbi:MAG: hypothetical protein FWG01_04160 [Betaproteobacteria bacterium]|nr:hypothetical protein [Betaproteobacteria bacterium]
MENHKKELWQGIRDDISDLYKICPDGGQLHIVVENGNLENNDIQLCLNNADKNKPDYELTIKIGNALLKISEKDRDLVTSNLPLEQALMVSELSNTLH